MRIGIDARFAGVHERGIGRYVFELASHLISSARMQKHKLVLFVTEDNKQLFKTTHNIGKVVVTQKWYSFAEQVKLPKIITDAHIDLMHFPHYNVPLVYKGDYIITIHDMILNRHRTSNASTKKGYIFFAKYFAYRVVLRNALKNAKKIIAVSAFTKREIIALYPKIKTPITVIHEGVSDLPEEEPLNQKNKIPKQFIVSVGSAYPHKNLEYALKLAVPLLRQHSTSYVLVGREDYFYTRLRKFVQDNNFGDVVIFFGQASDP